MNQSIEEFLVSVKNEGIISIEDFEYIEDYLEKDIEFKLLLIEEPNKYQFMFYMLYKKHFEQIKLYQITLMKLIIENKTPNKRYIALLVQKIKKGQQTALNMLDEIKDLGLQDNVYLKSCNKLLEFSNRLNKIIEDLISLGLYEEEA